MLKHDDHRYSHDWRMRGGVFRVFQSMPARNQLLVISWASAPIKSVWRKGELMSCHPIDVGVMVSCYCVLQIQS
jgi:hypothetical protein